MKHAIAFLTLVTATAQLSEAQYIAPDGHGEPPSKTVGFTENMGQLRHPDGTPANEVKFYSEGGHPRAFIHNGSKVSFVHSRVDTSMITLDTLRRIDMSITGELAQESSPVANYVKDWHQNFYLPHTGTNGVAEVYGFDRITFEDVYPDIDWHFYSALAGQKMSFVIRPGGNPNNIQLQFEGHDSIHVNAWGLLEMYIQGHVLILNAAIAYQVAPDSSIIPVTWVPEYVANSLGGIVSFAFGAYDPALPLVVQIGPPPAMMGGSSEYGLCWSTYLGGAGDEYVVDADEGPNGSQYFVTGCSTSDIFEFPFTTGNTYYYGGSVSFALGFDALDQLDWKTFIGGGMGQACVAQGVAVREGVLTEVYVAGLTDSDSLQPYALGSEFYQDSLLPGQDYGGWITRLTALNGVREWLTYFRSISPQGKTMIEDIKVAPNGMLYITGGYSHGYLPPLDDPAPVGSTYNAPAFDTEWYSYVAMFNTNDRLNWYTYHIATIGGGHFSWTSLAIGSDRFYVVGGNTNVALVMPTPPAGAHSEPAAPYGDIYLFEYNYGDQVQWATYLGLDSCASINGIQGDPLIFWSNPAAKTAAVDPVTGDLVICGLMCGSGNQLPFGPVGSWQLAADSSAYSNAFIARFTYTDRDMVWLTFLHGGTDSDTYPTSSVFDQYGNLYVGASVMFGSRPLAPLPGMWYAPSMLPNTQGGLFPQDQDAYLISFDPLLDLRYATYFGGLGGMAPATGWRENITAIVERNTNDNIYIAGRTSKDVAGGLTGTYFPLDDGGGTPYFTSAWAGGTSDIFLASICSELSTTVIETTSDGSSTTVFAVTPTTLLVGGIAQGLNHLRLTDAIGRAILNRDLYVHASGTLIVDVPSLASGVYVLGVNGGSTKFIVP